MKNHYIQATLDLILSGKNPDEVILGLKKTLEAKGYTRLYPSVLRGVLRILETKKDTVGAVVTVASQSDVEKYKTVINSALEKLTGSEDFSTHVDQTIIGGVVISDGKTVIDKSFKTTLLNLYRSITS
jgi:F0F1-type ATP synthase delta subunit